MLPANVHNKARHVIERVGWWVKEQFYNSIAIEGPCKWFNWRNKYIPGVDGASSDTIFRATRLLLLKAGEALDIGRSLHPRLTAGGRQFVAQQGDGDNTGGGGDDEDGGEGPEEGDVGFVSNSRYGIRQVQKETLDRYSGILAVALMFLNNMARDSGNQTLMPDSVEDPPDDSLIQHSIPVRTSAPPENLNQEGKHEDSTVFSTMPSRSIS